MNVRFSQLSVLKVEKLLEFLKEEWSNESKNKYLNAGKTDTIVNFQHYAVPEQAAFPANTFEGRLRFGDLGRTGINEFIIEDSIRASSAKWRCSGYKISFI